MEIERETLVPANWKAGESEVALLNATAVLNVVQNHVHDFFDP